MITAFFPGSQLPGERYLISPQRRVQPSACLQRLNERLSSNGEAPSGPISALSRGGKGASTSPAPGQDSPPRQGAPRWPWLPGANCVFPVGSPWNRAEQVRGPEGRGEELKWKCRDLPQTRARGLPGAVAAALRSRCSPGLVRTALAAPVDGGERQDPQKSAQPPPPRCCGCHCGPPGGPGSTGPWFVP